MCLRGTCVAKSCSVVSLNVICAHFKLSPSGLTAVVLFFPGAERAERSGAGARGILGDDWLLSL